MRIFIIFLLATLVATAAWSVEAVTTVTDLNKAVSAGGISTAVYMFAMVSIFSTPVIMQFLKTRLTMLQPRLAKQLAPIVLGLLQGFTTALVVTLGHPFSPEGMHIVMGMMVGSLGGQLGYVGNKLRTGG